MKKRFIVLIIVLITLFSLNSCGKTMSIDKAITLANKALNVSSEHLKIVGKFGEGFVAIFKGNIDEMATTIDGYTIPYSSRYTLCYIIDGKAMMLPLAYDYGYIGMEDLYVIGDRLKENSGKLETDYPLIDPNANLDRCIHKAGNWKTTTKPTCSKWGVKELRCKKCDKLLKTSDIPNTLHEYKRGKCVKCKEVEMEYEYFDTYVEAPSDMISFYGTYVTYEEFKNGKDKITLSIFGVDNPYYDSKKYSWREGYATYKVNGEYKRDPEVFYIISSNEILQVQYTKEYAYGGKEKELLDINKAYNEGIITKNFFMDITNKLREENRVGNYVYEHFEDKNVRKLYPEDLYPKEFYLNLEENLYNQYRSNQIINDVMKYYSEYYGVTLSYYGTYKDYYVGEIKDIYEYPDEETTVKVAGYKFVLEPYRKIVVFNDDKVYDLKTAYFRGILTKENIKEIYEYHIFINQED